jgi:hypothetical protein
MQGMVKSEASIDHARADFQKEKSDGEELHAQPLK